MYSSTWPRMSPSYFCRPLTGNVRNIAIASATSVVSKAVPRPEVMLLSPSLSAPMSLEFSSVPVKPPTAALTPITVPRNPRIGIAQMNTWNIV